MCQENDTSDEEIHSDPVSSESLQVVSGGDTTDFRGTTSILPKTIKVGNISLPKVGEKISCKLSDKEDTWQKLTVLSRAGKSTGKNKYCMNVQCDNEKKYCIDFKKM